MGKLRTRMRTGPRRLSNMLATSPAAVGVALLALLPAPGCAPVVAAPPPRAEPTVARLDITAPSGAAVHVDGVGVGEAPLPAAIDVDPGPHLVAVTQTGHESDAKQVVTRHGALQKVKFELDDTAQRTAAWILIGGAGPVLATGIVFGVLAVIEDRASDDILDRADEDETLSAEDQRAFDDTIAARDDYRIISGVAGGAGLGLFLVGGLLFAFDDPALPSRAISAHPLVGPGFVGATSTFRF